MVLRSGGRTLIVFDRWKGEWELPGGALEPGEGAEAAARRELREESGQAAVRVVLAGHARLRVAGGREDESCAVFTAAAGSPAAFAPTDEIGAIAWWDGSVEPPGGPLNPIDRSLIDLVAAVS